MEEARLGLSRQITIEDVVSQLLLPVASGGGVIDRLFAALANAEMRASIKICANSLQVACTHHNVKVEDGVLSMN